jgi:hypothetical protein
MSRGGSTGSRWVVIDEQEGLVRLRWKSVGVATACSLLVLIVVGVALAASSTIDTTSAWDGSTGGGSWGTGGATPTYGETVTGTGQAVTSFTFYLQMGSSGALNAQGGVGTWDGTSFAMTSQLWQGDQQVVPSGTGPFVPVTFTLPTPIVLQAGQQYVLYATTLGVTNTASNSGNWGAVTSTDPYADGYATYSNDNSTLLSPWDGQDWFNDFAFVAQFTDASSGGRLGYCSAPGDTNPTTGQAITPGTFLNLDTGQPTTDSHYMGAVVANYLQGLGITCDLPSGYATTGQHVGYNGPGSPGSYAYYAKMG